MAEPKGKAAAKPADPDGKTDAKPAEPEQAEPSAYIADEPLFIYNPESGAVPARAFNPGDRVLPADVRRFGWADQVHRAEE
jgi:hypothetical protein